MVGYKSVDDYVESGMVVGLGTGSTAYFAVERLGQKLKSGACVAKPLAQVKRRPPLSHLQPHERILKLCVFESVARLQRSPAWDL